MPLDARPFDALLLVSFGGPEQTDDVVPFLENVTRGRGIPRERLVEVGEHYFAFGGRSPINDQNRDLLAAIRQDLDAAGVDLPVYWGNRNWDPYLADAMLQMREDGVQHAACFVTSAYSSYSGCRQYRENLFDALESTEGTGPRLSKLRHYFNHPGFVQPFVDATIAALARLDESVRDEAEIVFVTHSIPTTMNEASGRHDGSFGGAYVHQHSDVATEVARRVHDLSGVDREFTLVYCSRSGSPRTPWLEPDVNDHLREISKAGRRAVVVVPIGFVSDHMEVVYDLDTEARETAAELGLAFERASTPGVNPRFVAMVRDLLFERAAHERGDLAVEQESVGALAPSWDRCPVGCCANARGERPAACGVDA
ncbi:MAG: ferrochelatase [Nocardioidaceae bacterium]|nr:ferrochelatase [Nocardioidaceae bacterium]